MDKTPRIDPNWTRKPPRPAKDDSFLAVLLLSAVVVLGTLWFARAHADLQEALGAARAKSDAVATSAHRRQREQREHAHVELRYISEAQAAREIAAAHGSSFQDQTIHRCIHGRNDTHQLGPCRAPWVEAPVGRSHSREPSQAQQAYARQQAEARLRAEQQRFAELTRQPTVAWQPGYSTSPGEGARQHCAWAKGQRDEAYRRAGNHRNFDFIRHWDDFVYEACKNA